MIAPGEPAAERRGLQAGFRFDRLQTKLEDLNPKIPLEGLQEALRKIRLISHPTLIENTVCFTGCWWKRGRGVWQCGRPNRPRQVWLIDFANPEANEFSPVNQFTVEERSFQPSRGRWWCSSTAFRWRCWNLKILRMNRPPSARRSTSPDLQGANPVAVPLERAAGDFRRPPGQAGNHHVGLGALHDMAHHHGQGTGVRRVRCNWKHCSKACSTSTACWT